MSPAISVRNLGKRYSVNHAAARAPYRTLRDSLVRAATAPLRRLRGEAKNDTEQFWALNGLTFEVQPGEVIGVIGSNGAGKSTLLKILSRITAPTVGEVQINGRVGSLLEVGTGFHPELSGRENVYMNGSILGMSRREIQRNFDTIVDFAGVGPFLDTPVKRYSSGMHVRLAFAVAAHLNLEILLVDEVLAVGDAEFQKRCLGKMREVSKSGRTVLFVSHHMGVMASLCERAVWLSAGTLREAGDCATVISSYMSSLSRASSTPLLEREDRSGNRRALIRQVSFLNSAGGVINEICCGDSMTVAIDYTGGEPLVNPSIHMAFYNDVGAPITYFSTTYSGDAFTKAPSSGSFHCEIPELPLATGRYLVNICLQENNHDVDVVAGAAEFNVAPGPFFRSGRVPPSSFGQLLCRHAWALSGSPESALKPTGETATHSIDRSAHAWRAVVDTCR